MRKDEKQKTKIDGWAETNELIYMIRDCMKRLQVTEKNGRINVAPTSYNRVKIMIGKFNLF